MFYRTNNPVADAERYQEELESAPHLYCVGCGEPLYNGDMAWRIEGDLWCEDCAQNMFREEISLNECD